MISAPSAVLGLVYRWTDHTINPTGEARTILRGTLKGLGLSGDVIDDGVLAVSELVANAHEHACGPYELHLRSAAGRYICEIHDGDPLLPADLYLATGLSWDAATAEGTGEPLAERGRGLRIVNELARGQWGLRLTNRGTKAAWVVVAAVSDCDAGQRQVRGGVSRSGSMRSSGPAEPAWTRRTPSAHSARAVLLSPLMAFCRRAGNRPTADRRPVRVPRPPRR
ncbi:ATP-binding protein [Streptomyces pathocidini]|uniref:ATP-binding protein n=1 Tax=Streptomyces pathocidini TaxID=1650571 RepID=UPI0034022188